MGQIGAPELIIVLLVVILLFGARKLPELGSSVGKSIRNFKKGVSESAEDETASANPTSTERASTSSDQS